MVGEHPAVPRTARRLAPPIRCSVAYISFYVFQLPLLRDLYSWAFQLLVLTTILVAALHYLNGGIRLRQGRAPEVSPGVKAHLSVLVAGLALLKAADYRLDSFDLLYSTRGVVFGASYTDVKAQLPALTLLALISLFAAALLLWNIRRRGLTLPIVAVGGWLVMSISSPGSFRLPCSVSASCRTNSTKSSRTSTMRSTSRACSYGLDKMKSRSGSSPRPQRSTSTQSRRTSRPSTISASGTLRYSRKRTAGSRKSGPTTASTTSTSTGYTIDGQLTQVMVATRETS